MFEFVSEIYNEANQWIYTFDSVKDIKKTMQNQLTLIFSDGLAYRKMITTPQYSILSNDLPAGAVRTLIEKPFAWEYKFLAYILKDEFNKLKNNKWDFKYGLFDNQTIAISDTSLLDDISQKFKEMESIVEHLDTLINTVLKDAIGKEDEPIDLEMVLYVSKRIAAIYRKLVNWALYFKSIVTNKIFSNLLNLLYSVPNEIFNEMELFINELFNSIISVPDIEDNIERHIKIQCTLTISNINEITTEINNLSIKLLNK